MTPSRVFDANLPRRRARAVEDLAGGARLWRLAWALALSDVRHRYRGSVLGPFWMTLSTAVMLAGLGFLYAHLFRLDPAAYLPWLTVSLIVWNILAQAVTDASTGLTSVASVIRQVALPHSVHAWRVLLRNALVALHNLPLIGLVFLVFGVAPGSVALLALPGLALMAIVCFAASLLLGMLCARFRDLSPIIGSVMQMAFFVSPVIWKPELLDEGARWLPLNPFFCLIETVRAPLLGQPAGALVWGMALAWTGALCAMAWAVFVRFRARIAFWV